MHAVLLINCLKAGTDDINDATDRIDPGDYVDNANSQEIMRQLQYLTMVLMSMYGHREIVTKASMQVLHDLVNVIILILLEPTLPDMPEGAQLVR